MKKIMFSALFALLIGVSDSYSQNYSAIYDVCTPDVRTRMDGNKIAGLNILDGINAQHVLKIEALTDEKIELIQTAFSGSALVESIDFGHNNTLMGIVSNASLMRHDLEAVLANFDVNVVSYSAIYSLKP